MRVLFSLVLVAWFVAASAAYASEKYVWIKYEQVDNGFVVEINYNLVEDAEGNLEYKRYKIVADNIAEARTIVDWWLNNATQLWD